MINHTETTNKIYKKEGFQAVLNYIKNNLEHGKITQKTQNIYCINTTGWNNDEYLLKDLTTITSTFGNKHYIGYIKGGKYYFSKEGYTPTLEITNKKIKTMKQ